MTKFDTLAAARQLEDAGMDAKQAAAVTHTSHGAVSGGLATPVDLASLRFELAELKAVVVVEVKTTLRQGLFVIRATGSSASIINPLDFEPRVFG